eukprot:1152084-Pelagomonas_calceolata.AAC.10
MTSCMHAREDMDASVVQAEDLNACSKAFSVTHTHLSLKLPICEYAQGALRQQRLTWCVTAGSGVVLQLLRCPVVKRLKDACKEASFLSGRSIRCATASSGWSSSF